MNEKSVRVGIVGGNDDDDDVFLFFYNQESSKDTQNETFCQILRPRLAFNVCLHYEFLFSCSQKFDVWHINH